MPIYEYKCKSCANEFEALVRNLKEKPECPACGKKQLERLMSAPSGHASGGSGGCECPARDAGVCGMPPGGGGCCSGGGCGF